MKNKFKKARENISCDIINYTTLLRGSYITVATDKL